MKCSQLMFFVIGVAIIFSGCSKEDSLVPDNIQNDQETNYLKAKKVHTHFLGECTPTTPPNPGDNAWFDDTDYDLVSGVGVWVTEGVEQIDEITFKLWGTAVLSVDGGLGTWENTWHGTQTLTSQDGSTFRIVAHAVGSGIEGDVEGLTSRWKYTVNYDGTPETFKYLIKGKVTQTLN